MKDVTKKSLIIKSDIINNVQAYKEDCKKMQIGKRLHLLEPTENKLLRKKKRSYI